MFTFITSKVRVSVDVASIIVAIAILVSVCI